MISKVVSKKTDAFHSYWLLPAPEHLREQQAVWHLALASEIPQCHLLPSPDPVWKGGTGGDEYQNEFTGTNWESSYHTIHLPCSYVIEKKSPDSE